MSQKPVGVILAGGQARRMGRSKNGLDKGLFDLGGQTMLLRVVRRLQPQVQSLVISANGDPARFNDFGLEVTEDSIQGYLGPLAGILAGLDWAVNKGATHVVSVAVDTPFFPCDLVVELQKSARLQKQPIVLAASHDPQKGLMRHPVFGLWAVTVRQDLRQALAGGVRKVGQWAETYGCSSAVFDYQAIDPFFNVNTMDDLAMANTLVRDEEV